MDPYQETLATVREFFSLPAENPGPYPVEIKNAVRLDLGDLCHKLNFTEGVEIGCWEGENAARLSLRAPGMHIRTVDAWVKYAEYTDHTRPDKFKQAEERAVRNLAGMNVTIIKDWSDKAALQVPNNSIDFLYIDGNHSFEGVCMDLFNWVPKVRRGGIISGHDYWAGPRDLQLRVIEAVHGYTAAHDIAPWFVLGRRKVRPGERHERERSWFWVATGVKRPWEPGGWVKA